MRIYKKCPCCDRTIFLVMEMELGSSFGSKDNMPHDNSSHEQDYYCLNKFLSCLENSHGKVFLSLSEKEESKIPKDYQELILNWTEKKQKVNN